MRTNRFILLSMLASLVPLGASAQTTKAEDVLSSSIAHHDPRGEWMKRLER